jgi:nucleoside-diphosphate-sugar epimerase
MKVLVLGSDGLVGKSVCKVFSQRGHVVVSWDITMGSNYDLRIPHNIDAVLQDIDFVIFLAFDVGGAKYNVDNREYMNNNIQLMYNTFNSLFNFKKPFIHTTSTMSNMNHNSYSVLKRVGELYTKYSGGINVKLWNVYGYESSINEKSHVIPDFIHQALNDQEISLKTNGNEERMFLHCDDFAEALYSVFHNYDKLKIHDVIDISSDNWISIIDVANIIQDIVKRKLNMFVKINVSENIISESHTSKNIPNLNIIHEFWKSKISLDFGIEQIINEISLKQSTSAYTNGST